MATVLMTGLSKQQEDCYFYYNATCSKGELCVFRHEPAAKTNEAVCKFWMRGYCNKPSCQFRHATVTVPKNVSECFFQNHPGGCKKKSCPFTHKNIGNVYKKTFSTTYNSNVNAEIGSTGKHASLSTENTIGQTSSLTQEPLQTRTGTPPLSNKTLIVAINDDSESESSPVKRTVEMRVPRPANMLDIERLRQIQREGAQVLGYHIPISHHEPSDEEVYEDHEMIEETESYVINGDKRPFEEDENDLRNILLRSKRQKQSVFDRVSKSNNEPMQPIKKRLSSPDLEMIDPAMQSMTVCSTVTKVIPKVARPKPRTIFQQSLNEIRRENKVGNVQNRLSKKTTVAKAKPSINERLSIKPKSRLPVKHTAKVCDLSKVTVKTLSELKASEDRKCSFANGQQEPSMMSTIHKVHKTAKEDTSMQSVDIDEDELLGEMAAMDDEELNEDVLLY